MVATLDAIRERENNLSIPLYVRRASDERVQDFAETLALWRLSSAELRDAAESLIALLDPEATG